MDRRITLLLCAFISVVLCVSSVAAQSRSRNPEINSALETLKRKNPELLEMVDEEKLVDYIESIAEKVEATKKKLASGKMTEEEAASLDLGKPSLDILKPEAREELASHSPANGIDLTKYDPATFNALKAKRKIPADSKIKGAPQTIVGHVKAGEVEAWPTTSEVARNMREREPDDLSPSPRTSEVDHRPLREDAVLPDIPRCPNDLTLKYQFGDVREKETTQKDILFIRGAVPSVPDELFGKEIRVYQYTGKRGDVPSMAIAAMHVQCLPFRMRLSEHLSVQDFGLNALKNYDRDFVGKGEFHPYVEQNQDKLLK